MADEKKLTPPTPEQLEAIKRAGERSDKDRERYMERFRRLERENAKRNNGSLDQVGGQEE